ncbi:MAG: hypothetical protein WBM34_00415 [Woeseiaceae bacterium]
MLFRRNPKTFRLAETIASFSLSSAQLHVGYLENGEGKKTRGVDLVFPRQSPGRYGPRGTYSYIFRQPDASRFLVFLDEVLSERFPAEFQFSGDVSGRWFSSGDCKWVITKFVDKWHGGGGFKGHIDNSWSYVITKSSAQQLRHCVQDFFIGDAEKTAVQVDE